MNLGRRGTGALIAFKLWAKMVLPGLWISRNFVAPRKAVKDPSKEFKSFLIDVCANVNTYNDDQPSLRSWCPSPMKRRMIQTSARSPSVLRR
jgi:hypothetical protein